MGWLQRHRPVEAILDPESNALSMSRIASWILVCLDIIWVVACILRLPAPQAYGPVSSMLGICTGAALAAYGANSAGRTFGGSFASVWSSWKDDPGGPPPTSTKAVKIGE
jgi:hypothetical protein